ncbi:MAG: 3'-5' exonuclease [Solirubrobacterales bacterium]
MDSFVAIDFETATWGAACAVGIVHFENGVAIEQRYTLIDPQISPRRWQAGAIRVHGITPRDVIGQPSFADIWPELIHYAACYPLVAHNANFDMGVLRSELARFGLQTPTIRYGCSMALARRAWPRTRLRKVEPDETSDPVLSVGPENHKLSTLSAFLEIELDHHHALSDAIACGMVTVAAVDRLGHNTLAAAYDQPHLSWGELSPELAVAGSSRH